MVKETRKELKNENLMVKETRKELKNEKTKTIDITKYFGMSIVDAQISTRLEKKTLQDLCKTAGFSKWPSRWKNASHKGSDNILKDGSALVHFVLDSKVILPSLKKSKNAKLVPIQPAVKISYKMNIINLVN